jgi:hypothetical protein
MPLSYLRLIGAGIGAIALAGLLWLAQDRFQQKAVADQARACEKAAADPADLAALTPCLPDVGRQILNARMGRQCDGSLASQPRSTSLYAIRSACSDAVNHEVAARAAAEGNLADREKTISTLQANMNAAVARAETRVTDLNQKGKKADEAIDRAPRRADGIAVCDTACLYDISGE